MEHLILPLRRGVRGAFQAHLSGAPLWLLQGILPGDKHSIPQEAAGQFRYTGLAHAVVISGLHVGLVTVSALVLYAFVTDLQARWCAPR